MDIEQHDVDQWVTKEIEKFLDSSETKTQLSRTCGTQQRQCQEESSCP
jgi:hypothetical protein